ncbi:MAG TPA: L,D-transpeptidase family protein, partial [Tenuifilaceae bacterium]|nr:L,D-transpeptidase family protein [Tenuifilaceae bacterium]
AFYTAGLSDFTYIDSSQNSKQLIARVQSKLGLTVDSTLNAQTHEVLVSMLQYRYFQACLNINRLRQMNGLEGSFLFVNIPEFKLHVIDSMKELETFRVIVGKAETPTPVFSGKIDRVVTNPYWTVPKSIVAKMLHKIRSDSTYLTRNGYYVINSFEQKVDSKEIDWSNPDPLGNRYALRQRNSTSNALGLIKFLFPNDYSVYIHDTPSRNLFNHEVRTFSHGCIRLENPDKLAQFITDRFVKDELNIQQLISTRSTTDIELSNQLDVHIQYITCTAAEDRNMQFFADIYNRDKQEIMATFPGLLEI